MDGSTKLFFGLVLGLSGSSAFGITTEEAANAVAFWHAPGRLEVASPDNWKKEGRWQVRLTTEGSKWIWNYYRARGFGKVNPQLAPHQADPSQPVWTAWIEKKIAYDRYRAACDAASQNIRSDNIVRPSIAEFPAVGDPGPCPADLAMLAGEPPAFAHVVKPLQYKVSFPDGGVCRYITHVKTRTCYAYYRFDEGVDCAGKSVRGMLPADCHVLFSAAGLDSKAEHVMSAVSILEGGFESVNTYDTGFLSVGLLQFAALAEGSGSLGELMVSYKRHQPTAFARDFVAYGIDVADNGSILSVDIERGEVLAGTAAVQNIIKDKRLTAVFQHAGEMSREFRVAQLVAAKERFYPAQDVLSVRMADQSVAKVVVGSVVRSEAGLATLMDRKVNIGNIRDLASVLTAIAAEHGVVRPEDLAAYEELVIARMRYRKDYLSDVALSQPRGGDSSYRGGPTKRGKR